MIEPIARIRIELRSVEPHVWRRVDVPLSCTLLALHDVIQIAMGWTDSHIFELQMGDRAYGALDLDSELEPRQYLELYVKVHHTRCISGALPMPLRSRNPLRKLLVALEHKLLDHDSLEERFRREVVGIGSRRGQRASDFVLEPGGQ